MPDGIPYMEFKRQKISKLSLPLSQSHAAEPEIFYLFSAHSPSHVWCCLWHFQPGKQHMISQHIWYQFHKMEPEWGEKIVPLTYTLLPICLLQSGEEGSGVVQWKTDEKNKEQELIIQVVGKGMNISVLIGDSLWMLEYKLKFETQEFSCHADQMQGCWGSGSNDRGRWKVTRIYFFNTQSSKQL